MSQVTIYLDKETEEKMRKAAEASGMSRSKWLRSLIQRHTAEEWPEQVQQLTSAWPDFPDAESLRADLGEDAKREAI